MSISIQFTIRYGCCRAHGNREHDKYGKNSKNQLSMHILISFEIV
jgi:hypothetical protein